MRTVEEIHDDACDLMDLISFWHTHKICECYKERFGPDRYHDKNCPYYLSELMMNYYLELHRIIDG